MQDRHQIGQRKRRELAGQEVANFQSGSMLAEQDCQFGIHFLWNRGTGVTTAALPATTAATAPTASAAAPATPAPATYGFDYEIGRFAFLCCQGDFRSRHAALHGLQLISGLHFVQ